MTPNSPISNSCFKLKTLFLVHLYVGLSVFSLFSPSLYQLFWATFDEGFARLLQAWACNSPLLQNFWAMANHRIADIVEDVFFLFFFLWLLKTTPSQEKLRKTAEFLFVSLVTTAVILFINNFLFKQVVHIPRKSPSLVLDAFPRLSEQISWLQVKDKSKVCFPSDHATTALLFIANFLYLSKNKLLRASACLYGTFLCFPRMVAGAHWITDILLGSASLVLLIFSWVFCTPFADFCIRHLHRFLLLLKKTFPYNRAPS